VTQELRRREAYLAEAQRLSHTGSFGWKPDSGEIVWSDETYRIFEYDNTLKPTIDSVLQRVHPQDRALVQQVIDRASQTGTDFEHEYRLLLPDGRVKHVHAIAHAVQNASGDREFIGAVTDITGRKTAEDSSEMEFRQILDLAPQQVAVLDPLVNVFMPTALRSITSALVLKSGGKHPEIFFVPVCSFILMTGNGRRALFDSNRSCGSAYELELRVRGADGSYRWFLVRYNPLHDERDRSSVGMLRDGY
jgi:PAS domain-containing protein